MADIERFFIHNRIVTKKIKYLFIFLLATPWLFLGQVFAQSATVAQPQLNEAIRAYILDNPEVIIESLRSLESKAQAKQLQASKEYIQSLTLADLTQDTVLLGDGDVTVVEFLDYQCGYCKRAFQGLESVLNDGSIQLVIREFPILGPTSEYAARVALAAVQQGQYKQVHDALMMSRGQLDPKKIDEIALRQNINMAQLKVDMNSPEADEHIRKSTELASALNITGTPAFLINGQLHVGFMNEQALRELIKTAKDSKSNFLQ